MNPSRAVTGMFAGLLLIALAFPGRAFAELQVAVSILPQKYFVQKIGGDAMDVSVMVEPGADPHVYDPRPQQMVGLARSKIYFAIGVPFETVWLDKFAAANPGMLIVHTETGIDKIPMRASHEGEKSSASSSAEKSARSEEHVHGTKDPHVWLSPPSAMVIARNILDALLRVNPSNASTYQANYRNFIQELVALDIEIMNVFLRKSEGAEFMVFHPAWGYFAAAYGLKQIPIEIEGKEPKPADLKQLIEHARDRNIKVIFVQPQFSAASAQVIANAIDGQIVHADPLAPDWLKNLREVAQKFREALQ